MKALTLYQPWATLVTYGVKCIETRTWPTAYRGPLVIHASKNVRYMPHLLVLLHRGQIPPEVSDLPYPTGALLGEACLIHCAPAAWFLQGPDGIAAQEQALGDYGRGRWGWVFREARPYERAEPWRGRQGLWTLDRHKDTDNERLRS